MVIAFSIIFIHWIADFILQSRKWAVKKHEDITMLMRHVIVYSSVWIFPITLIYHYEMSYTFHFSLMMGSIFSFITFVFHFLIDYITSRVVTKKFQKQDDLKSFPNFSAFTIIGLDQVLHYFQLFLTYELLKTFFR